MDLRRLSCERDYGSQFKLSVGASRQRSQSLPLFRQVFNKISNQILHQIFHQICEAHPTARINIPCFMYSSSSSTSTSHWKPLKRLRPSTLAKRLLLSASSHLRKHRVTKPLWLRLKAISGCRTACPSRERCAGWGLLWSCNARYMAGGGYYHLYMSCYIDLCQYGQYGRGVYLCSAKKWCAVLEEMGEEALLRINQMRFS